MEMDNGQLIIELFKNFASALLIINCQLLITTSFLVLQHPDLVAEEVHL